MFSILFVIYFHFYFEINKKMKTGSMCFMKTMWRWLVDHTWEESEQEMTEEIKQEDIGYGNELI